MGWPGRAAGQLTQTDVGSTAGQTAGSPNSAARLACKAHRPLSLNAG